MEDEKRERFEELLESDQNDAAVQYEIGRCYLYGEGVEQNGQAAEKWLRRAAEQDYPEAKELLESVQIKAEAPAGLTEETLPDWCMRAENGEAEAQYQVACYFQEHQVGGGAEDTERYLTMAVEQGHPQACLLLAKRKLKQRDYQGAVEHLRNAADCGVADAAELLGQCYSRGEGVDADPAQAEVWFAQAAQLGGPTKMVDMAVRYALGDGVPASYGKAMSWLKRAEEGGLTDARGQFETRSQTRKEAILRQQEEEAQRRREEEARRQQEAQRKQQEEARRKQEEEARRRKEEEARRQQQAEAQRKQEEEARRRKEEETRRQQAEVLRRQQEEARHQQEARRTAEAKAAKPRKMKKIIVLIFAVLLVVSGIRLALGAVRGGEGNRTETGAAVPTEDVESLPGESVADLFQDLDVVFHGMAPNGEVDLLNNSTDPFIQTVTYSAEPDKGLSVGDQVEVTAYFDEEAAKEAGYKIQKITNTYTVQGLDAYVTSLDQIDEACLTAMEQQAQDMVEAKLANYSNRYLSNDMNGRFYDVTSVTTGKPEQDTAYLLTLKNGYSLKDYYANCYIVTYRTNVTIKYSVDPTEYNGTAYFSVLFYNLTVSPDGVTNVSLPDASLKDLVTSMDTVYRNRVSAFKDTYIVTTIPMEESAAPAEEPPAEEAAPDNSAPTETAGAAAGTEGTA